MTTAQLNHQDVQQKGLARMAEKLAGWTQKWFPDAYIFALAGVLLVAIAALAIGASPKAVVDLPCRWPWWC